MLRILLVLLLCAQLTRCTRVFTPLSSESGSDDACEVNTFKNIRKFTPLTSDTDTDQNEHPIFKINHSSKSSVTNAKTHEEVHRNQTRAPGTKSSSRSGKGKRGINQKRLTEEEAEKILLGLKPNGTYQNASLPPSESSSDIVLPVSRLDVRVVYEETTVTFREKTCLKKN
jgi:hypothetical protein